MAYSKSQIVVKLVHCFDSLSSSFPAIGDVLISADRGRKSAYDSKEFDLRLRSFQSHVLREMFVAGLRVVARANNGRLHCHAVVALPFPIVTFDWYAFDLAEQSYQLYKKTGDRLLLSRYRHYTKQYRNSMPEQLRSYNKLLQIKAVKYGLGRVFILPIRKNTEALKWYLVHNLPKKRAKRDKQVHFLHTWGINNVPTKFKAITPYYQDYRQRLQWFSEGLYLTNDNYHNTLREILGVGWHWVCRDYIAGVSVLPNGLYMPAELVEGYESLKATVKQYLLRTGQYRPTPPPLP